MSSLNINKIYIFFIMNMNTSSVFSFLNPNYRFIFQPWEKQWNKTSDYLKETTLYFHSFQDSCNVYRNVLFLWVEIFFLTQFVCVVLNWEVHFVYSCKGFLGTRNIGFGEAGDFHYVVSWNMWYSLQKSSG